MEQVASSKSSLLLKITIYHDKTESLYKSYENAKLNGLGAETKWPN
jgi:hypothetical protein